MANLDKGYALYSLNRYEDAMKCYDHILEIDYLDTVAHNNKAFCLYKLNKTRGLEYLKNGLNMNLKNNY